MSHQQRANEIRKARGFEVAFGLADDSPKDRAIDDLLTYIEELEELLSISEAESERLLSKR